MGLNTVCDRIVPQPRDRPPIPVAAVVDDKMVGNKIDGYRNAKLPRMQEAWRRGLHALDEEAKARCGGRFGTISGAEQDTLIRRMQQGKLTHPALPRVLQRAGGARHRRRAGTRGHPHSR
jgi:hypothetical protein